ncbi:TetR/AcrR family transcriptional regulator [Geminicoccaceae bacterium 1502E]|nr:TetR/AcrR family transcriptional regulator [Geminicoccaceae bacterium 1502E]
MAEPARRRRRKEARPQEILEAALALFTERGFSATRLDDIAARAGVSKGTLYLYFASKEAIFSELVRHAVLPNIARVEALVAGWSGSRASLLRRMIELLGTALREDRIAAFPKLVIAESGNFPELARQYREEVIERGLGLFARVIAAGVAAGEFREVDSRHAAKLCVAPMLLLAVWRTCLARADEQPLDAQALVETHVETLLRGLAAKGGPVPEGVR